MFGFILPRQQLSGRKYDHADVSRKPYVRVTIVIFNHMQTAIYFPFERTVPSNVIVDLILQLNPTSFQLLRVSQAGVARVTGVTMCWVGWCLEVRPGGPHPPMPSSPITVPAAVPGVAGGVPGPSSRSSYPFGMGLSANDVSGLAR